MVTATLSYTLDWHFFTGCPACIMQISDMLSKAGEHIAVRHPVQIYAEALKGR